MQLSVIILNYNVRYFLEQCVLSVQAALQDLEGEIIVVDNNSSDNSCAMMRTRFPEVQLIENKENVGFPKGNNIGVAAAKGEYICILNPDTVVAEDAFVKIFNTHFSIPKSQLGIIGCKLIDGTGRFLPESKRGIPTPWVALTKMIGFYKLFPKVPFFNQYYAQHLSENQSGVVPILVGAFMVMKRELYCRIGGFDENCFMYADDIDLSYRVLKEGKSNYYFAETTVVHYKGESTVRDQLYRKRFQEAMQYFYSKHFKKSKLFGLFMRMGSFFFVLSKKQSKTTSNTPIDHYVLLSNDEQLKKKLEKKLGKKVVRISISFKKEVPSLLKKDGLAREVLFDQKALSFAEIITFMALYKGNNLTFKIIPNQMNVLIGSNSSNHQGEIVSLF